MEFDFISDKNYSDGRRKFINKGLISMGGIALLSLPGVGLAKDLFSMEASYTVQDIIDIIIKDSKVAVLTKTVDTIKFGSADSLVKGIVLTMFPTVEVIEQAALRHAKFIIAHEPSFFNGQDNTSWVPDNKVVQQKQQLLEKHQMTIWRFHDYCHRMLPDMVGYGVLKKMNWLPYYTQGETTIKVPTLSLQELVHQLKAKLEIQHVRVMGDLSQRCSSIGFLPGAAGGQRQISLVEEKNPDVLIVGEQVEWETTEYIRDAQKLGAKTALIILGHSVSEEPGMEAMLDWLSAKVPGIAVSHIASGDPYTWM
jgi:putative NIF3 family GTP cyclohydrolase 1 type 2